MPLKASLATKADLDALAEPLRALYVEKEGKFILDAEGLVPAADVLTLKTSVAEFRDKNIALLQEVEPLRALKDKYKDVDPAEYTRLKTAEDAIKKKGGKGVDDIEAMIANAVTAATKPLADKLAAEEQRSLKATQQAEAARFRELVTADATKAGVKPQSVRHVLREAEEKFELKDGALVPKPGVKHPTEPHKDLTTADWLQDLAKSDDYLFAPSTGGGANGGAGGGGRPGAKQLVNPSPEEMGRHMDAIAKGEMVVVRQ